MPTISNFNPLSSPVPEESLSAKRKEICDAICSFADLEFGWDGFEGIAPSQSDIDNALDFIGKIPLHFMVPKAMLSGDGDVGFTWRKNDDYAEVGFPDGKISYGVTINGEWFYADATYNRKVPPKLLSLIEEITKNNRILDEC